MSVAGVEVFAPAKVNLRLEVKGRREDGFHELDTWMMALDFGDRLSLDAGSDTDAKGAGADDAGGAGDIALSVTGPFASPDIPTDGTNLVVRALAAARERARELGSSAADAPLRVELDKRIPSQSGLGGASSDASAALGAFERRFDLDLGGDWRRASLARLGSDCVFFEEARIHPIARCEGRGENITARVSDAPPWFVALVTPDVHCATPDVYAALEFPLSAPPQIPIVQGDMFTARARDARRWSFNHLESAAARQFPEVARWRSILESAGNAPFVLSGSGSSFFGLFDDRADAERALESIRTEALKSEERVRGTWVARARRSD